MATIINSKPVATPLIPLANPDILPAAPTVDAIKAAMSKTHDNKMKSKKGKKAKKHQKANQTTVQANAAPVQNNEPVKDDIVIPEVKTSSVVIAHTEEKEATKAAIPDERMKGLYADFEGIKNEILAAHKNGAILPEGFAKAVREIADTIDAVEKVDSERRGISIKKETYGTGYNEPAYDTRSLDFCPKITNDLFDDGKYMKCFIPLHDFAVEAGKYPKTIYHDNGRSILSIISDNMQYISDKEIITTTNGVEATEVTDIGTNMSRSGYLLYDADPDFEYENLSPWRFSYFLVEFAIPKKLYLETIAQHPEVIVCSANERMNIANLIKRGMMPSVDGESISDLLQYSSVGMDNLDDISEFGKMHTHALSFADIEKLVHDPSVLIGGLISSNQHIIREIGKVYPRAVASDGNVIICDNHYFDPYVS